MLKLSKKILVFNYISVGKRPGCAVTDTTASKVIKKEADSPPASTSTPCVSATLFSNDGNFLQRFKQLQEIQAAGEGVIFLERDNNDTETKLTILTEMLALSAGEDITIFRR